jgi:hypothetical protein
MASRKIFAVASALLLAAACNSSVAPLPTLSSPDSTAPVCPLGPSTGTASLSTLPTGSCNADNGPCYFEGTPCPATANGTVNSYVCNCQSAQWTCELIDQSGFCAPLPPDDGGSEDSGLIIPDFDTGTDANEAGAADATVHD